MTRSVSFIDEDTPIAAAWECMQKLHIRHLPVVEGGRLLGMVSDRDLLSRAIRGLDGQLSFPELCAAEVMSFGPVACAPDTPVSAVALQMLERHIDAVPVVVEAGELIGMVTSSDLLRLIADAKAPQQMRPRHA